MGNACCRPPKYAPVVEKETPPAYEDDGRVDAYFNALKSATRDYFQGQQTKMLESAIDLYVKEIAGVTLTSENRLATVMFLRDCTTMPTVTEFQALVRKIVAASSCGR